MPALQTNNCYNGGSKLYDIEWVQLVTSISIGLQGNDQAATWYSNWPQLTNAALDTYYPCIVPPLKGLKMHRRSIYTVTGQMLSTRQ